MLGVRVAVVDGELYTVDTDGSMHELSAQNITFTHQPGALSFEADGHAFETECEDDKAAVPIYRVTNVL